MRKINLIQKPEKKNVARAIALAMATVLFASTAFTTQVRAEKENEEQIEKTLTDALENEAGSSGVSDESGSYAGDTDKEETVYVFSDANGNTDHILVSGWLKNRDGSSQLQDVSDLSDIVNVKGDENFTQSGSKVTWQADGKDIYYQGTSKKETPVDVKITYYLDDEEVSPEQIAGKDGKVKIRFDYSNHTAEKVMVGGKEQTVSVPFVVLGGMVLPVEHFSNVEVTNGKVISEGNNMIVAGMALPGLKDTLKLEKETLKEGEEAPEIPDFIEVTADAKDFALDMTISLVLNDVFSDIDLSGMDTGELQDKMNDLSDASGQLVDGSGSLKEGTDMLQKKVGEFNSGLQTLDSGVTEYTKGVGQLAQGTVSLKQGTEQLAASVPDLTDGVSKLKQGSSDAKDGIDQIVAGYAGDGTDANPGAAKGAKSLAKGAKDLAAGTPALVAGANKLAQNAPTLAQGAKQVSDGVDALRQGIDNMFQTIDTSIGQQQAAQAELSAQLATYTDQTSGKIAQDVTSIASTAAGVGASVGANAVISAVQTQLGQAITGYLSQNPDATAADLATFLQTAMTQLDLSGDQSQLAAAIGSQLATDPSMQSVKATFLTDLQDMGTVAGNLGGAAGAVTALQTVKQGAEGSNLSGNLDTLSAGAKSVSDGTAAFSTGAASLAEGAGQIDAGVSQLATGAESLNKGINGYTDEKGNKVTGLYDGSKSLQRGLKKLKSGMTDLSKGSTDLADGVKKLDKGAGDLMAGAGKLDSNSATLTGGSSKILEAGGLLADGVETLDAGAGKLQEGMLKFDAEGIQKLTNAFDGDLSDLYDRIEAAGEAAENYDNFSGKADGKAGNVKFIIKTGAVKVQ